MSEKKSNSIGARLLDHYNGRSGNIGILNYKKTGELYFTQLDFEMLRGIWKHKIENLESYFILDFAKRYGAYPICNNKTGYDILQNKPQISFLIDWKYFEMESSNDQQF